MKPCGANNDGREFGLVGYAGSNSHAMWGLCASAEVVFGFPGLLEVFFGVQYRADLSSSLNPCNMSPIHLANTKRFIFDVKSCSRALGYVRLCGVNFGTMWGSVPQRRSC